MTTVGLGDRETKTSESESKISDLSGRVTGIAWRRSVPRGSDSDRPTAAGRAQLKLGGGAAEGDEHAGLDAEELGVKFQMRWCVRVYVGERVCVGEGGRKGGTEENRYTTRKP